MRLHLLFAAPALLLVACPPTSTCPAGQIWNGSMCVAAVDVGPFDGGRDASGEDAPCGGGCTAPLICNVDNNECVECLGTDASSCGAGQNACVDNTCVACDDDADCEALDAAECDTTTNTCVACTDSTACAGRTGTEVCNAGTCVECSADDESACGSDVCNLLTNECDTGVTPGSVAVCGACTNDRACMTGQVCAHTEFPVGSGTEVGNFCLWRQDASPGPAGACSRVPPYRRAEAVTSVGATMTTVCAPAVSTCSALGSFLGTPCGTPGMTPPTTPEPVCGIPGVDDGFCRVRDGASNRCSVECSTYDDCPCVTAACSRQYACDAAGFCEFSRSCDVATGTCG